MFVLPGDTVSTSKIGPGLQRRTDDECVATIAGELREGPRASFVESNFKRYIPARGDAVVGIVSQRGSEAYRISLQPQSRPVRLGVYAFENATRKNKPNLAVGDVVYARVSSAMADNDMDTEIECVDGSTGKAAGFGPLSGGTLVNVGLGFARQLLFCDHPILEAIGSIYEYEVAIGLNGKIWLRGPDERATLRISNWLVQAEHKTPDEAVAAVH